jgi:hypothetical protein
MMFVGNTKCPVCLIKLTGSGIMAISVLATLSLLAKFSVVPSMVWAKIFTLNTVKIKIWKIDFIKLNSGFVEANDYLSCVL